MDQREGLLIMLTHFASCWQIDSGNKIFPWALNFDASSQFSQTLIDVNNKRRFLSSGELEPHLSDHSLVYAIMRTSAPPPRSRKIMCRSFKNYNRDEFANDLALVPFHGASIFDHVDDQAWAFTKLLTDVIDIHAPVKQFHVRGGHVPYMTPQWRRAIRHRNRLWKKYKLDPNTIN